MSNAIRDSIRETFGFEEICINSARVSAQNRQRYYWVGKRNEDGTYSKVNVEQPVDRGILLKDVLDGAVAWQNKSYTYTTRCSPAILEDTIKRHRHTMVTEPLPASSVLNLNPSGNGINGCVSRIDTKARCLTTNKGEGPKVIVPVSDYIRVGCMPSSIPTCVAQPITENGTILKAIPKIVKKKGYLPEMFNAYNRAEIKEKAPTLSTGSMVTSSCAVNIMEQLYSIPCEWDANGVPTKAVSVADGKIYTVYAVSDGKITIKDKTYPIKLADGYYIIRKLTVAECKRLQTVPEWYDFSCVSNAQAYKMLGNGWTCEVIVHLIKSCLNSTL